MLSTICLVIIILFLPSISSNSSHFITQSYRKLIKLRLQLHLQECEKSNHFSSNFRSSRAPHNCLIFLILLKLIILKWWRIIISPLSYNLLPIRFRSSFYYLTFSQALGSKFFSLLPLWLLSIRIKSIAHYLILRRIISIIYWINHNITLMLNRHGFLIVTISTSLFFWRIREMIWSLIIIS